MRTAYAIAAALALSAPAGLGATLVDPALFPLCRFAPFGGSMSPAHRVGHGVKADQRRAAKRRRKVQQRRKDCR